MNTLKEYLLKRMKIKRFTQFISETALIMTAPNYGYQSLYIPLRKDNTEVLYSNISSKFYTYQDYQDLYQKYLANGGEPLTDGFNIKNLETVISHNL